LALFSWLLYHFGVWFGIWLAPLANGEFLLLILFELLELFTWLLIIYFLASAIFLSMSLTFYILNGIRKIPMNITPFDNFSTAKPLRILEAYSVNIMLVVFVLILIVLSALQIQSALPIQWLAAWFKWAVALLFVILGFGLGRSEYLVGALLYFSLLFVVSKLVLPVGGYHIDASLLTLGVFFTSLMAFHLQSASQFVTSLLAKAKTDTIRVQKDQLRLLYSELERLNNSISNENKAGKLESLQAQRHSVLASIQSVIGIMDHVEKIEISKNLFRKIPEILTPVVSSIILPLLLDQVKSLLHI